MIHPIVDEFYSHNPAHTRSSGFAQAKGQTVTGADKKPLAGEGNETSGSAEESGAESEKRGRDVVDGAIRRLRVA